MIRRALLCSLLLGSTALAKRPPPPATPPAIDKLLDSLALGLPPAAAAAALDAVGAARSRAAFDVLSGYAHHLDPVLRAHALGALASIDDARVAPLLLRALGDVDAGVRAAAGAALAARGERAGLPRLILLLKRGDPGAVKPLAALADADTARRVAELGGAAPEDLIAGALGAMLLRSDLGPEETYVGVVRALGGMPGKAAGAALDAFLASAKKGASRPSVKEARALRAARVGP